MDIPARSGANYEPCWALISKKHRTTDSITLGHSLSRFGQEAGDCESRNSNINSSDGICYFLLFRFPSISPPMKEVLSSAFPVILLSHCFIVLKHSISAQMIRQFISGNHPSSHSSSLSKWLTLLMLMARSIYKAVFSTKVLISSCAKPLIT